MSELTSLTYYSYLIAIKLKVKIYNGYFDILKMTE